MSHKQSMRSRSSLSNTNSSSNISTPIRANSTINNNINSTNTSTMRSSFRPPSRPTIIRSSSPIQQQHHQQQTRSRPSSSLANSRPGTPINSSNNYINRQEPYTGTISVSIRPNPQTYQQNQSQQQQQNWNIDPFNNIISNTLDGTNFIFDKVFPANDINLNNNYQVYKRTCKPIIDKFLNEGYNGTVFAYGMTGSGKTYSMKGDENELGFIELSINEIFAKINKESSDLIKFQINLSYLEIYNEKIIDLLSSSSSTNNNNNLPMTDLKIRDDPEFGIKVVGLNTPLITSKDQILSLIRKGDLNRKTSATDFNSRSSRSHSILQIRLKTINTLTNNEILSTLSLCDLAGSERASSSLERRKEGSYINKSLLALSNVINRLSSSSMANSSTTSLASMTNNGMVDNHISYRDSKLTRLLQPALSGKSLVSILCTIHMGSNLNSNNNNNYNSNQSVSETYKTLRFAARAKNIVINVEKNNFKNIETNDLEAIKLIQDLNQTIEEQKKEIFILKSSSSANFMNNSSINEFESNTLSSNIIEQELKSENKILIEKLNHLNKLVDLQNTETIIIKDNMINDILGCNLDNNTQLIMTNIEEFYKRINHEINEYKNYIKNLESQLKIVYQQNSSLPQHHQQSQSQSEDELMEVLKEQEEEIIQLKNQIQDKDHIIKSFTKTTKFRKLIDSNTNKNKNDLTPKNQNLLSKSNYSLMDQDYKRYSTTVSRDSNFSKGTDEIDDDKENEPEIFKLTTNSDNNRDLLITPKKPRASFDILQSL
ncbi:KIP2 [Candida pseudojiufengensis]|uniref:KIP2 n=1 Tax=Candida pseudojiufengensis TaxID=497109 RepID=UPI00222520D0|nr:KIP2 [Candida pseudojiufengensis]KAI5960115.1 KIP2 [Candida pseudojiufengensis]